jgi:hypothetical protein
MEATIRDAYICWNVSPMAILSLGDRQAKKVPVKQNN